MAFELPAEEFIVEKLRENFPDIDIRSGTAFRDMLISPISFILQPYRDQVNIMKRNLSLQNYSLMDDQEMEMLVNNVFVDRREGSNSTGSIRIYTDEPQDFEITTDVVFSTREGLVFRPSEDYYISAEEIELNNDGVLYYYDLECNAESPGTAYNVEPNTVIYSSNLPAGIIRITNPAAFASGVDADTNEELYSRAKYAISVRDLVSKKSIMSTLLADINTIVEIFVIGFGDAEMNRDLAEFTIATADVVTERITGEIDQNDIPGLLIDNANNFYDDQVSPGHSLIVMDGADIGQYPITNVLEHQITIDGTFAETRNDVKYRVGGISVPEQLHVGGKVDIYLNTTVYTTPVVVALNTPEIVRVNTTYRTGEMRAGESKIYDLSSSFFVRDATINDKIVIVNGVAQGTYTVTAVERDYVELGDDVGNPVSITKSEDGIWYYIIREYYEDDNTWQLPLMSFSNVSVIDPVTREILATLEEGVDYELIVNDPDTRYSTDDDIVIRLLETNIASPDYYIGSAIEFTYFHDPSVVTTQAFVDNDLNRVLTASLLAKSAVPSFVDIEIIYKGDVDVAKIESALQFYIRKLRLDEALKASDIIQYLQFFNVTYVKDSNLSVKMTARTRNIDGTTSTQVSTDYIKIPRVSKFISEGFTITKTDAQFEEQ